MDTSDEEDALKLVEAWAETITKTKAQLRSMDKEIAKQERALAKVKTIRDNTIVKLKAMQRNLKEAVKLAARVQHHNEQ